VPVATAFLFAVLPYRVTGVTADASQTGRTLKIDSVVQVSQGSAGRHVVNVQVTDVAGRKRPEYGMDVIARNGRASHSFSLALNDPAGQWTIEVEDVTTGTTGKTVVQVELN